MLNELEKSILKVVGYFDLLSYPLTLLEIYKWLEKEADFLAIKNILNSNNLTDLIGQENGFYFLAGQNRWVNRRLNLYPNNYHKFKKALKIVKILRFFPYLRAVAVYSSLSLANSRIEGDIDLFMAADSGRVWTARFFINLFLKIFNLRPNQNTSRDKICVSYLASHDNLDLSLANDGQSDYYYRYLGPPNFVFIYDEADEAQRFFEKNDWIKEAMPDWYCYQHLKKRRRQTSGAKKAIEFLAGLIGEKIYQVLQMAILPERYKKIMNQDKRVIINECMIKLHDNETKRRALNRLFESKFQNLIYGR